VLTKLRRSLVPLLPRPLVAFLRALRTRLRRLRYRFRRRGDDAITREAVAAALSAAGLREGDGVFVHGSLSRFGHIEGGPETVLAALEDVLGPEGLIVMPTFPLVGGTEEYLAGDPVFDVGRTPSTMGALSERFRVSPGTVRSLHPTHPVSARGPGAEELVAGHADASTPFGDGTPFARMIERGAVQVWFGVDLRIFTIYHAFECLRPAGFPIPVFHERRFAARCVDERGRERTVETLVHDPAIGRQKNPTRAELRRRLTEAGVLHTEPLGRGEILTARMPELMHELERLLQEGLTIYDIELGRAPSAS
jgi:aminoglycoside 3-N-acetyltransferase